MAVIKEKERAITEMTAPLGARITEETVIAALNRQLPATAFVSLHAQFFPPAIAAEYGFNYYKVLATEREDKTLRSLAPMPELDLARLAADLQGFASPFLNMRQFGAKISYAAMELFLPIQYLQRTASAVARSIAARQTGEADDVIKAITARYLLRGQEPGMLYDYFLPVKIERQHGWIEDNVRIMRAYLKWRHGIGQ